MFNGVSMPTTVFKSLLKQNIRYKEWHEVTLKLYKTPYLFSKCITGVVWPWYAHASKNPEMNSYCVTLMRLIVGLEGDMSRKTCSCVYNVSDMATYLIFECTEFARLRENLWKHVISSAPLQCGRELENMSINDKAIFLLNDL